MIRLVVALVLVSSPVTALEHEANRDVDLGAVVGDPLELVPWDSVPVECLRASYEHAVQVQPPSPWDLWYFNYRSEARTCEGDVRCDTEYFPTEWCHLS